MTRIEELIKEQLRNEGLRLFRDRFKADLTPLIEERDRIPSRSTKLRNWRPRDTQRERLSSPLLQREFSPALGPPRSPAPWFQLRSAMEGVSGELPELGEDRMALPWRKPPAVAVALIKPLFEDVERNLLESIINWRPKLTRDPDPSLTVGKQEFSPPELAPEFIPERPEHSWDELLREVCANAFI